MPKLNLIKDLSELQAGDIILFNTPKRKNLLQVGIAFVQDDRPDGSDLTTHAGICVGKDEQDNPLINHMKAEGYVKEELLFEVYNRSGCSFRIFRDTDKNIANAMVDIAKDLPAGKPYNVLGLFKTLIVDHKLKPNRKESKEDSMEDEAEAFRVEASKNLFCSQLIVRLIKAAHRKIDIASCSTPQALHIELASNPAYEQYFYSIHNNFYTRLLGNANQIFDQLQENLAQAAEAKEVELFLENFKANKVPGYADDLEKALAFLAGIIPVLESLKIVGFLGRTSKSKHGVTMLQYANTLGIYSADIMNFSEMQKNNHPVANLN